MTTRFPRIAAAALVGGLALGVATPALAVDDDTEVTTEETKSLRDRCQRAIERRLGDLSTAQGRIAGVDALTDAHEATLNGIIDSTESGLEQKSADIEVADTRAELVELCAEIATEFRVYLVVLPQTHLTVGADRVDAAVVRGDELVAAFDDAVVAAIEAGADVDEAVALRDAAAAHLAAASDEVVGVADAVLAVTPQDWNNGPGEATIDDARTSVRAARDQIREGVADGQAALQALREALDAVGSDA